MSRVNMSSVLLNHSLQEDPHFLQILGAGFRGSIALTDLCEISEEELQMFDARGCLEWSKFVWNG
jgi:hypothetical protein